MGREQHRHPGMEVYQHYVIISDKYPKAQLHALVIARDPALSGPADLRRHHLPLLQEMKVRWNQM